MISRTAVFTTSALVMLWNSRRPGGILEATGCGKQRMYHMARSLHIIYISLLEKNDQLRFLMLKTVLHKYLYVCT